MIGVITVNSQLENTEKILQETEPKIKFLLTHISNFEFIGTIKSLGDVALRLDSCHHNYSGIIILAASGGTEILIEKIAGEFKKPILLWAISKNNSLPSMLESYAFLKRNRPITLIYNDLSKATKRGTCSAEEITEELNDYIKFKLICDAIEKVDQTRLGIFGAPSSWILTSRKKENLGRLRTKLIDLNTKDLKNRIFEMEEEEAIALFNELSPKFGKRTVSDGEVQNAIKVYLALKEAIMDHNLSAISVCCYNLQKNNLTACLALSMLNEEGIISGCEGDIQATVSMIIASALTNNTCWMANAAQIDLDNSTITLAHCSVPLNMLQNLSDTRLLSHMETNKNVAVGGPLKKRMATLIRLGGDYDQMTVATGRILETDMRSPQLCRTQAVFQLDGSAEEWIENALGNHHVLTYGNIKSEIIHFCQLKNIKPIII